MRIEVELEQDERGALVQHARLRRESREQRAREAEQERLDVREIQPESLGDLLAIDRDLPLGGAVLADVAPAIGMRSHRRAALLTTDLFDGHAVLSACWTNPVPGPTIAMFEGFFRWTRSSTVAPGQHIAHEVERDRDGRVRLVRRLAGNLDVDVDLTHLEATRRRARPSCPSPPPQEDASRRDALATSESYWLPGVPFTAPNTMTITITMKMNAATRGEPT